MKCKCYHSNMDVDRIYGSTPIKYHDSTLNRTRAWTLIKSNLKLLYSENKSRGVGVTYQHAPNKTETNGGNRREVH